MKILREIEKFELHNKIFTFLLVVMLTILITRMIVQLHNPNPIIFGFEFHHFDYGVLLLIISTLLLLFAKRNDGRYLLTSAIAIGLIIDDVWFVRSLVVENDSIQTQVYNSTFYSAIIFSVVLILGIMLIKHFSKSRK